MDMDTPKDDLRHHALQTFFQGIETFLQEGIWEPFENNCLILAAKPESWEMLPKMGFFTHSAFMDSLKAPADYRIIAPRLERLLGLLAIQEGEISHGKSAWLADAVEAGWPTPALRAMQKVVPCENVRLLWTRASSWVYAQDAIAMDDSGRLFCKHDTEDGVMFWRQGDDLLDWMATLDPGMKHLGAFDAQSMMCAFDSLTVKAPFGEKLGLGLFDRLASQFDFPKATLFEEIWSHEKDKNRAVSWADVAVRMDSVSLFALCLERGVPLLTEKAAARKKPAFRPLFLEMRLKKAAGHNAKDQGLQAQKQKPRNRM